MSKNAVANIIQLYATALDSHSWDLFEDIFTPDVEADYCNALHWFDLASFLRDFTEMHEATAGHQHFLGVPQIVLDGDRAFALTYGRFNLFRTSPAAEPGDMSEGGVWYDDELIRTSAGWRIRKRFARNFWWQNTLPADGPAARVVDSFPEWVKSGRSPYMNALREQLKRRETVPG